MYTLQAIREMIKHSQSYEDFQEIHKILTEKKREIRKQLFNHFQMVNEKDIFGTQKMDLDDLKIFLDTIDDATIEKIKAIAKKQKEMEDHLNTVQEFLNEVENKLRDLIWGESHKKFYDDNPNETSICSICYGTFTGYGHNAAPVKHGRCCESCNTVHVIPTRIRGMFSK